MIATLIQYLSEMEHTIMIRWLFDEMKVGKAYPITNGKQRRLIKEVWDVIHLQDEYEFKFNEDFSEIKKVEI